MTQLSSRVRTIAIGYGLIAVMSTATSTAAAADDPPGYHRHDGFYARLGAGPGYLHDGVHYEATDPNNPSVVDGSISGGGVALEVALGGAVVPGLIVGGGLFHTLAFSPKVDVPGIDARPKTPYGHFLISPVVDFYPDPTAGLHFEAGVGLALSSAAPISANVSETSSKLGFGGFLGVGQEWWVAGDWGMGALVRASFVRAKETQGNLLPILPLFPTSDWEVTHTGWQLALLGTVTYN